MNTPILAATITLFVSWSEPASAQSGVLAQHSYLKASNPDAGDQFAHAVAISGDTIVIGAQYENSSSPGVNGDQSNNSLSDAGAAYVFVREGSNWVQQAYLKASNPTAGDRFGYSVAISGDTIVIGAVEEDSNATGVNGAQANNSLMNSGAAYVFVREGTNWVQQAYLKASNTALDDLFGDSVAISGNTIIVSALLEASNATGVNGDQNNNLADDSGAAYVFVREGTNWTQQAYLKASNTESGDLFFKVALSGDTAVVGAIYESSNATGVNGNPNNNLADNSGAAYVFVREGTNWVQQAYLKASNTGANDNFFCVGISGDTIAVGAHREASNATGVNGIQTNNQAPGSGAVYIFVREGTNWTQQAYLKASNTGPGDEFGWALSLSENLLVVGAHLEGSNSTGVNGIQTNNLAPASGAAYLFVRQGTNWTQRAYLKASNTSANDEFGGGPMGSPGTSVAVSGTTIVVGASYEGSSAAGVNGNQQTTGKSNSGAAYIFEFYPPPDLSLRTTVALGPTLSFSGPPNLRYELQRSPALPGAWETLQISSVPILGAVEFIDPNPPLGAKLLSRFVPVKLSTLNCSAR